MLHGLAILVIALWSSQGFAETKILNIRHWAAPDHTRVVIDTSEESQYTIEKKDMLVSIQITDAQYVKGGPRTITIRKPGIDKIKLTTPSQGIVSVDLYLTAHTETKVFRVEKIEEKPDRIVIDIILPEVEKEEQEDRERVKIQTRDKIVVIDPGHGGEDPGAVGRNGTYEKKIVLEIGKKVRDKLNAREGYHAFLTREGDYYVSFKKRLKIAREYGADLFVSIHADAARSRQASGTSVYSLSLRSASSEAAKILARNENLADIVGGAVNGEATSDQSDPIILNMFQTSTMNSSRTFGQMLLKNMTAVNRIKFNSVQEAPFMVLKLPEVPSVLVETAYLSNPKEEKKLRNRQFQNEIAEAIVRSVVAFLSSSPVKAPTLVTTQTQPGVSRKIEETGKKEEVTKREDVPVKDGLPQKEDLSKKENVRTTDGLTKKEDLPRKDDIIGKGDQARKKEPGVGSGKTVTIFHMVKRGESIDRIARKYHVNPALILKTNGMKPKDPLYANRKIKIPLKGTEEKTANQKSEGSTPRTTIYIVKKGDSLDTIARKHKTTVNALKDLNQGKRLVPLYVDQRLKIPGTSRI